MTGFICKGWWLAGKNFEKNKNTQLVTWKTMHFNWDIIFPQFSLPLSACFFSLWRKFLHLNVKERYIASNNWKRPWGRSSSLNIFSTINYSILLDVETSNAHFLLFNSPQCNILFVWLFNTCRKQVLCARQEYRSQIQIT